MISCTRLVAGQGRRVALPGLDLHVDEGEMLGVLGPNGSGKSTLLKVLAGLLVPASGEALVHGLPVCRLPARHRARLVGMVPQRLEAPEHCTVFEFVRMGRYARTGFWSGYAAEDHDFARQALRETGLTHLADRETRTLSGGELQRCAIARLLCQRAPVMLLDEPNSNLDLAHRNALITQLQYRHAAGATVVCVLHDINMAALFCRRLIFLKQGQIVLDGPPQQVLRQEALESIYDTSLSLMAHPDFNVPQVALRPGDVFSAFHGLRPTGPRH